MDIRVEEYIRPDGSSPYADWFNELDAQAAAKHGDALALLFGGGTKRRQQADIERAIAHLYRIQDEEGSGPTSRLIETAEEVIRMALTRDFKQTVVARVERDPAFAKELLDEATTLLISGEPEMARVILRDIVNATLGFEQLAILTLVPSKSLQRMLSPKGNPSMDNLAAIFGAVSTRISRSTRSTRPRKVA